MISESEEAAVLDKPYADSLDIKLENIFERGHLPGFAVAVFNKDDILYQRGFGYANRSTKQPYTPETVQLIASTSKTLIGVALMKVVEEGLLSLDDDINEYLPFTVVNPHFPEHPITIRHLATHTSSIKDSDAYQKTYIFSGELEQEVFPEAWHSLLEGYNSNVPMEMPQFLENILSTEGPWYSEDIFTTSEPGASYEYSNVGASLAAYIVGRVTGLGYEQFTSETILKPLRMESSTWVLEEVDKSLHATYYLENQRAIPNYTVITAADGGLYSSVLDLTNYLQTLMKAYEGESTFLTKESFTEMTSKPSWDEEMTDGIFWDLSFPCCIGHTGNDFGTSTLMYFQPETGIGRILFSNTSIDKAEIDEAFYDVFNALFEVQL